MKKVYTASGPAQAHLVKDLLEMEGVEAIVQGEGVFSAMGGVPFTYPSVWIANDEDLELAEQIVADFEESEKMQRTRWRCPICGEEQDKEFDVCWNCGAERPEISSGGLANREGMNEE